MKTNRIILAAMTALMLTACGTTKNATKNTVIKTDGQTGASTQVAATDNADAIRKLSFVQKVSDNAAYQQNIVSKINFTVETDSKSITVPGSIHMRKDDVIRVQLMVPLLGTEVGRLEFTKDYVMIIDRMHKEYIKEDYNQVDFLSRNGINFYSLQALFWNQLFVPGQQKVTESLLREYDVDLDTQGDNCPVTLKEGNMSYVWMADKQTARIDEAQVTYNSASKGSSSLTWKYGDFKTFGSKKFPASHKFNITTGATGKQKSINVSISMTGVTTDSDWESRTTVSDKYQKVKVDDVIAKIMSL